MAAFAAFIDIWKRKQHTKVNSNNLINVITFKNAFNVPEHDWPFPLYPSLHEQL